jgi:Flp pilus assembly protein TadD
VELFETARRLDPEEPVIAYRLAETHAKRGDAEAAAQAYRRALELDPDFARARLGLGQALLRLGEVEGAVEALEEAHRLEPRDATALMALAQARRRAGRPEEAARAAELAAGLGPVEAVQDPYLLEVSAEGKSSTLLVERALAYLEEGRFREALVDLLSAAEERPEDPYIQRDLGKAYQGVEDLPAAIGHYEKALALKEDLNEVRVQLGLLLVDAGRIPDARRYLERARRDAPEDPRVASAVAIALLRAGQIDGGLQEMERAAALGPLSAPALDAWGTALAQRGRTAEARARFLAAHELVPEEPLVLFHLGLLSEAEGQRDQALVWYGRALDIAPNPMVEERIRRLGG